MFAKKQYCSLAEVKKDVKGILKINFFLLHYTYGTLSKVINFKLTHVKMKKSLAINRVLWELKRQIRIKGMGRICTSFYYFFK